MREPLLTLHAPPTSALPKPEPTVRLTVSLAIVDEFVAGQPDEVLAVAAVPLPGTGSPIGGLIVYLEEEQFGDVQRQLLEATARRVADAVRRIRAGDDAPEESDTDEPDTRTDRIALEGDPRAAGAARRFLRDFLAGAGVSDDLAATAELCLSELVTNAIVHTGSRFEIRATLDEHLTVSVKDRGRAAADPALVTDTDCAGSPCARRHGVASSVSIVIASAPVCWSASLERYGNGAGSSAGLIC